MQTKTLEGRQVSSGGGRCRPKCVECDEALPPDLKLMRVCTWTDQSITSNPEASASHSCQKTEIESHHWLTIKNPDVRHICPHYKDAFFYKKLVKK